MTEVSTTTLPRTLDEMVFVSVEHYRAWRRAHPDVEAHTEQWQIAFEEASEAWCGDRLVELGDRMRGVLLDELLWETPFPWPDFDEVNGLHAAVGSAIYEVVQRAIYEVAYEGTGRTVALDNLLRLTGYRFERLGRQGVAHLGSSPSGRWLTGEILALVAETIPSDRDKLAAIAQDVRLGGPHDPDQLDASLLLTVKARAEQLALAHVLELREAARERAS